MVIYSATFHNFSFATERKSFKKHFFKILTLHNCRYVGIPFFITDRKKDKMAFFFLAAPCG